MSDSILRPYLVQNSEVFQEQILSQIGDNNHQSGMSKKLAYPNVAVYLRCSSEDQSVDAQQRTLSVFLHSQGLEIDQCNLYIDEGVSAKKYPSFTDRTEGSRLVKDIESGLIDTVWAFRVDRLFRSMEAGSAWLNHMKKKYPHVKVHTTDCMVPHLTSAGRSMWYLLLMIAEGENEARAERTTGGMQHKQELCQKTSHSVFGWEEYTNGDRNITQGRDVGPLIMMRPNWHEQAVRNWMIENPGGFSANKIAQKLNDWNIPTATGRRWTASSVRSQKNRPAKLHDQIHQFEQPKRMLSPPFRNFKPAFRF